MLETPSAPPPPPSNPTSDPLQMPMEPDSPPSPDLSSTQIQPISHPAATSSPQRESVNQDAEAAASLDPNQESGPMLYLSESLQESLTADALVRPATESGEEQTHSASESPQKEPVPQSLVESVSAKPASPEPAAQEPSKPKKDRLAMLKKLGLDPPPVAKLCPDDGAFVQLEPPEVNPGEKYILQGFCAFRRTRSTVEISE